MTAAAVTEAMSAALLGDLFLRLPRDRAVTMVDLQMAVDVALVTSGYAALADYVVAAEAALAAAGVVGGLAGEVETPPDGLPGAVGDLDSGLTLVADVRSGFNSINQLLLP